MGMALPELGVIEGFYGEPWSQQQRFACIDFLANHGFSSYCYAPKSDLSLRNLWFQNWDDISFMSVKQLATYAKENDVAFSIGLTPLDLHKNWHDKKQRQQLKRRLQQIKALEPAAISILFDDMWGDVPSLAEMQVEISHFIADEMGIPITICPSYYSFDPILEELFGKKPENYWQALGEKLDASIDCYWTGDYVITEKYSPNRLQDITEFLQRKPVIWDNSRVNDGRKTSPFLPVKAMSEVSEIAGLCKGFVINPMNAPALARLVMQTLLLKGSPEQRLANAVQWQCPELRNSLMIILPLLTEVGLHRLTLNQRQELVVFCQSFDGPVVADIRDWLAGKFIFDPACLT